MRIAEQRDRLIRNHKRNQISTPAFMLAMGGLGMKASTIREGGPQRVRVGAGAHGDAGAEADLVLDPVLEVVPGVSSVPGISDLELSRMLEVTTDTTNLDLPEAPARPPPFARSGPSAARGRAGPLKCPARKADGRVCGRGFQLKRPDPKHVVCRVCNVHLHKGCVKLGRGGGNNFVCSDCSDMNRETTSQSAPSASAPSSAPSTSAPSSAPSTSATSSAPSASAPSAVVIIPVDEELENLISTEVLLLPDGGKIVLIIYH